MKTVLSVYIDSDLKNRLEEESFRKKIKQSKFFNTVYIINMNNIFFDKNNYYSILYIPTDEEEGIIEENNKEQRPYIIYCLDRIEKKFKKRRKYMSNYDYMKNLELQIIVIEKFIEKLNKKYKKLLKVL